MIVRRLSRRIEILPSWIPCAWLCLLAVAGAVLFLHPIEEELPLDDAYIHLVYAENLVEHGDLFFNSPGEPGIATSSILWVLLLAVGKIVGLPMQTAAKALGVVSLATVSVGAYFLLQRVWGFWPGLVCATLVALSGNMLWLALCGMETVLFLALGILSLLAFRGRRWWLTGGLLGLLTLTRVEGVMLAVALSLVEVPSQRRLGAGLSKMTLVWGLVCAPWLVLLLLRTGHPLPTTGLGKELTSRLAIQAMTERIPGLAGLAAAPALVYVGVWLVFLLEFNLGGMTMPGPSLTVSGGMDLPPYGVSVWAIGLWIAGILPLLWAGGRIVLRPHAWKRWIMDGDRRTLMAFGLWTVLHNLSYMIYLPSAGTAGRYSPVNPLMLWMLLTAGLFAFARRARQMVWFGACLLAVFIANLIYWDGVYAANMEHMIEVRIPAAEYVREELAPSELCASIDIGVVRYVSRRPVVDLWGILDPENRRWYDNQAMDHFLLRSGATCVIVPGRGHQANEGWFDLAMATGLRNSEHLTLVEMAAFDFEFGRWLRGYLAAPSYQKSIILYRVELRDPAGSGEVRPQVPRSWLGTSLPDGRKDGADSQGIDSSGRSRPRQALPPAQRSQAISRIAVRESSRPKVTRARLAWSERMATSKVPPWNSASASPRPCSPPSSS